MKLLILAVLWVFGASADKIIGGTDASSRQFSSIVYQRKSGSFFCGGTIVSSNRVLSAAHCEQDLTGLTVTGGTTSRTSGGVEIAVSGKLVHPSYNSNTIQNDIMILYLKTSFYFGSTISAAFLQTNSPAPGTGITVAGWGDTNAGIIQNLPSTLQYVNVEVIATKTCNARTAYNGDILDGMICMGNMAGGQGSCQGDSGGPAYIQGSSTIAGIVSWGYGCAQANKPGVYTDVAYFRSWINSNL